MNIRAARQNDVPRLVALWRQFIDLHAAIDAHYQAAPDAEELFARWLEQCLANRRAAVLVAEDADGVQGYCLGLIEDYAPIFRRRSYGLLSDLAVDETHRDAGLGSKLTERMLAWFRGENVREVHVFVLRDNRGADRFWRRHGWRDFVQQLVLDFDEQE